jgi:hypothetical protein
MSRLKLLLPGILALYFLSLIPVHAQECTEFWVCSDWSFCLGSGVRMRTCSDLNRCGTADSKPVETQKCTLVQPKEINLPENNETGGVTGLLVTNTPTVLGAIVLVLFVAVYLTYKKWKDVKLFISSP